jgi:hypothetical protein
MAVDRTRVALNERNLFEPVTKRAIKMKFAAALMCSGLA